MNLNCQEVHCTQFPSLTTVPGDQRRGIYYLDINTLIYYNIYTIRGNKFLLFTIYSPYNNNTNQMTANVQVISIIINKLSKIMSN